MKKFRFLLIIQIILISTYTTYVGLNHGWNLFPVFFGDILNLNWSGQFNLDFTLMLSIAALWTAWRNNFTAKAYFLSLLALIGGISFLSIYLLYLTYKEKSDIKKILLGNNT